MFVRAAAFLGDGIRRQGLFLALWEIMISISGDSHDVGRSTTARLAHLGSLDSDRSYWSRRLGVVLDLEALGSA